MTLRIEMEVPAAAGERIEPAQPEDPAFGLWKDREEAADVCAYARALRNNRYSRYE